MLITLLILLQSYALHSFIAIKSIRSPISSHTFKSRVFSTPNDIATTTESLQSDISKTYTLKQPEIGINTYITVFGILPTFSFFAFDRLLSQITDFNIVPSDRQYYILALLLLKRLYIYAVAITTVELAAKRSVDLPGSLGQVIII